MVSLFLFMTIVVLISTVIIAVLVSSYVHEPLSLQKFNGSKESNKDQEDDDAASEHRKRKIIVFSWLVATAVVCLWSASWFAIDTAIEGPASQGAFGDKFGAINALFSGFAFLGVVVAILLQREELEQQRVEIRASRLAQRDSADALRTRLELEREHARRDASLDLFNEWHSPEMHSARRLLTRHITSKSFYRYSLRELEDDSSSMSESTFKVLHFFEKWARLARSQHVDQALIKSSLWSYVTWWQSNFLDHLKKTSTQDPDFPQVMEEIEIYIWEACVPVARVLQVVLAPNGNRICEGELSLSGTGISACAVDFYRDMAEHGAVRSVNSVVLEFPGNGDAILANPKPFCRNTLVVFHVEAAGVKSGRALIDITLEDGTSVSTQATLLATNA